MGCAADVVVVVADYGMIAVDMNVLERGVSVLLMLLSLQTTG